MKVNYRRSKTLKIEVSIGRKKRIERPSHLSDSMGEAPCTLRQLQGESDTGTPFRGHDTDLMGVKMQSIVPSHNSDSKTDCLVIAAGE
jgi:hypothetical protein